MIRACRPQTGFSLIAVLIAIIVVGVLADVAVRVSQQVMQREREELLLHRGQAYRTAIRRYYHAVPGQAEYPRSLEDLLSDPRFSYKRHIRQLYVDPVNSESWLLIKSPQGGVMGVVSRSKQSPIKQSEFAPGFESFAGAKHYSDWVFEYRPKENKKM